jgi:uncharacterized protein (DUF58 family)
MSGFIWLILLLLGAAFLLRVDFIYYVLYVAVGVYAWSVLYTPRAMRNLTASRKFRRRAFLGETVNVSLELQNKGRLSIPWIQIQESVPIELRIGSPVQNVTTLRGHQAVSLDYQIKGQQRGYYRLGPLRLTSGDLFGLAKQHIGLLAADYLTIYPRIISLERLGLPSRLPFGSVATRQRLFEDPARPIGVRDFRSGDSLRRMNWKASAHTQRLLVRNFEPAISLESLIVLDLNSTGYERRERRYSTEWAIISAAALANHLIEQRQSVGLVSNGVDPLRLHEDTQVFDEVSGRLLFQATLEEGKWRSYIAAPIRPHAGRPHLMKILEQLARLETHETIPFSDWAPVACVDLGWGVTILAIVADGNEATCRTLHQLVGRGFNVVLVAVEPDANFGLVRERARTLGFRAYNITSKRDFEPLQVVQTAAVRGVAG